MAIYTKFLADWVFDSCLAFLFVYYNFRMEAQAQNGGLSIF